MQVDEIVAHLQSLADPAVLVAKEKKFAIKVQNGLGVYLKEINSLAKTLPKDADLALELFDTGIYEARLLCSKVFPARALTDSQAERFVTVFDNWEITDSFCMAVVAKSPLAVKKINDWADRQSTFERRAAFATLAGYCMADKKSTNAVFIPFFDLIEAAAEDDRLYVRKAVNWALRGLGKRNVDLRQAAVECCQRLLLINHKAATWIAKDALRELENPNTRIADYPRKIYRPS